MKFMYVKHGEKMKTYSVIIKASLDNVDHMPCFTSREYSKALWKKCEEIERKTGFSCEPWGAYDSWYAQEKYLVSVQMNEDDIIEFFDNIDGVDFLYYEK